MTIRHLHSTAPHGSARPAEYTIKQQGGRYRIYDKQQRFRCEFATPEAANAYVASRTAASHNNALSDEWSQVAA